MGWIDWLGSAVKSFVQGFQKKATSAAVKFGTDRAQEWLEYDADMRIRNADRAFGNALGIKDTQNPVDRALEKGVDAIHNGIGRVAAKTGYEIGKSKVKGFFG